MHFGFAFIHLNLFKMFFVVVNLLSSFSLFLSPFLIRPQCSVQSTPEGGRERKKNFELK